MKSKTKRKRRQESKKNIAIQIPGQRPMVNLEGRRVLEKQAGSFQMSQEPRRFWSPHWCSSPVRIIGDAYARKNGISRMLIPFQSFLRF
jgi:hypothetical protein